MPIDFNWNPDVLPGTGVIVGCTQNQEWLLPWWWMHYHLFNHLPVTFIDFGDMSAQAVKWCKKRGSLIHLDIPTDFIAGKDTVDPKLGDIWQAIHPEVWQMRLAWFKKPFALLQSPYQRTLWMDLDCQTRASVQPILDLCSSSSGIAMVEEPEAIINLDLRRGLLLPGEKEYNSGVMVFDHGIPVIQTLARKAVEENRLFIGDQQMLGRILFTENYPVTAMPSTYNCRVDFGINPNALVLHWLGRFKNKVREAILFLNDHMYINLSLDS